MTRSPSAAGSTIAATTRLAAVIGAPVSHSRSPALHNAAFAAAGIDAAFVALPVTPAQLADAVAGFRALGFLGVSVTVPHKRAIVPLCDRLSPSAQAIGAVNCLRFERADADADADANTAVIGHNTDAGGFVDALRRDAGRDPADARVVLLGAGGAARAVHAGLEEAGAAEQVVIARTPDKVTWTAARPWTQETLAQVCRTCDLLVDCTSAGLSPATEGAVPCAIPVHALAERALVASLVYHRQPALLARAAERGLATMDGAGMLVYQGARAFQLWTGREPPVAAMWHAMRRSLQAPPAARP